ncbi:MAG: 2OG-Fe(II) oxygenase [Ghiorsea sp.]|nr:2OG-Fe(II) oxygenase [Ghiorsea sp.]
MSIQTNIAQHIAEKGYCVIDKALPEHMCQHLYQHISKLPASTFKDMGIGRGDAFRLDKSYRSDTSRWLTGKQPIEQDYLRWMETLRVEINQHLFMGLVDYEAHFAHYAPKGFYKRHLDAFKGSSNRMLTTVYYLNPDWGNHDGGELLMYANELSTMPFQKVAPQMNRLVVFLSDEFPHEVLPAQKDRYSIAGWFRRKA